MIIGRICSNCRHYNNYECNRHLFNPPTKYYSCIDWEHTPIKVVYEREIDDLGRVVIPKEVRVVLEIKALDTLYLQVRNGEVIITKEAK